MAKRSPMHTRKSFVSVKGEASRSAKPDTVAVRFEFLEPLVEGQADRVVRSSLDVDFTSFPETIRQCAAFYGLSQKLGDAYASMDKLRETLDMADDYDSVIAETVVSDLVEDFMAGAWVAESEGNSAGAGVKTLREAIIAARNDAGLGAPDELDLKLQNEDYRKGARSNVKVAAHIRRIEQERAAVRAARAAIEAEAADDAGLDDL